MNTRPVEIPVCGTRQVALEVATAVEKPHVKFVLNQTLYSVP